MHLQFTLKSCIYFFIKYTCSPRTAFYFFILFLFPFLSLQIFKYLLYIFYWIIPVCTTSLPWGFVSVQICILIFFVCLAVMNQYVFFIIFSEIKVSSITFRKNFILIKYLGLVMCTQSLTCV